ncbi:unnamed protein product [Adineta ricciae]|uniref:G-protein coupled receptors family 1 profile domain-containing protein n=1 Tax=Adineta ricciae TaxID=249248 RepID=A0A813P442_ADIRI|nr:unnamed protein product [Adineta ricciae]CAF1112848.1 unnamed protein product [Adineta ricciae]
MDATDNFNNPIVQSLAGLHQFEIIAACILYSLGFIGNFFALIVFSSLSDFRKISTGVLFLLMTVSNFFHLWTLATESTGALGYQLYPHVVFQCRLNPFVKNVSRAMSTSCSICIALDRLLRSETKMPMRSKVICTRRNVCKLAILLLIIFCLFWSFYLFPLSTQDRLTRSCYYNQSEIYYFFLVKVNVPMRAVLFCAIPVITMIAANGRMLYNIRQSHLRITHVQTRNTVSQMTRRVSNASRSAVDQMLLYLMIANVGVFIITQVPFHFYAVMHVYFESLNDYIHLMIYATLLLWSSIYFGVAFYLYCLTSPLFRKKFIEILKKILHYTNIGRQAD